MHFRFLFVFLFILKSLSAQVVINEVNLVPAPDATAIAVQSLRECSSSTAGSEYIELYNSDPCASIDISCYIIGTSGFLNSQTGTFRFPAGTVIFHRWVLLVSEVQTLVRHSIYLRSVVHQIWLAITIDGI